MGLFAGPALAFPDTEKEGVGGLDPPFDFGFSDTVVDAVMKDDGTMLAAYGEVLDIVDMGYYMLAADQPPPLDIDADTDGRLTAIAYSSDRDRVYAPQEDGDCLVYDLANITADPVSVEIVADNTLGPIALDNNSQRAYIANNVDHTVAVLNLSNLSVENTILLNMPGVSTFTITDAVHVILTNDIYFATDKGSVFYLQAGSTAATEIIVDATHVANMSALAVTPAEDYVYVTNQTDYFLAKISTSSHVVVNDSIDLLPNVSPTDIVITKVTNPKGGSGTANYAFIAGSKGISIMNTAGDLILDMGTDPAEDHEPLPITTTPKRLLASSVDDGYIYSINSSQNVDVVTANPWVTVSAITYSGGGTRLGIGETVTIDFQADDTGTAVIRAGGDVSGNGTALVDDTGASSWNVDTPDTDVSVTIPYDANSSAFIEGDNDIFIFVTDADSNRGRIAATIDVDTPPPNVTLQSTGFGNAKVYVTIDRLDINDISHYNIYADTSETQVMTKTEIGGEVSQPSAGSTVTGSVSGLTNGIVYFIAVEAVDESGNVSPSRTNTLSDGSVAYAIPQPTAGPAGFSGETGGCSIIDTNDERQTTNDKYVFVVILVVSAILLFAAARRQRRAALLIFFAVVLVSFFSPPAQAQTREQDTTPQWWSIEVKTGFWLPQSDAVNHFFTDCCNLITRVQGGLLVHKRYGVELGVGFLIKNGTAVGTITGEQSSDRFNFIMIPMETSFTWRMDYWTWDYLLPYVKGGLDYVYYRESLSGSVVQGLKLGFHGGGGLQLNMKMLGADAIEDMDRDFGINDLFLTLEAMYQFIDNFGSHGLDLSGPVFSIGLLFEF